MSGFFKPEAIFARPGYNRWRVPPASICIHLCIGSVYAWSIYNPALTKAVGVAASSAEDWSLGQVVQIFVVAIVFVGLSAAFAGTWLEKSGPRTVGLAAAAFWGGGHFLGGAGILLHELPLVYLGYGVVGGIGLGLGYVSPVATLIRWFPDRKGLASGMAIMGFGGGAILAIPMKEYFLRLFHTAPEYLGRAEDLVLRTEAGRRYAEIGGALKEVVVVSPAEVAEMIVPGLPGVYEVGTGSVGAAQTFFVLGFIYAAVIAAAAFTYRLPPPGWKPEGWEEDTASRRKMRSRGHVEADQAIRTPQFYQLWIVLCMNVAAGIAIIGLARTMVAEIFGTALPGVVDAAFAATYVVMISVFNMVGRLLWAGVSDVVGRKAIFWLFFAGGMALFLSIPLSAWQVGTGPSMFWLSCFYAATMIMFTFYGGGFASIPAYVADLFGTHHVAAIHGRLLTAWSVAGVLGPLLTTTLRQYEAEKAIRELAAVVDPARFQEAFGAGVEQLDLLADQQTVTLSKLLEIAPAGTADPTSGLYNSTMIAMAFLLFVGLIANAMIKPVDPKHFMRRDDGNE